MYCKQPEDQHYDCKLIDVVKNELDMIFLGINLQGKFWFNFGVVGALLAGHDVPVLYRPDGSRCVAHDSDSDSD